MRSRMEAQQDASSRRPSTEDICREAAERLGQMHIRSFRDELEPKKNELLLEEIKQDHPPPYSPYPYGTQGEHIDSPASFLVPPPPPPSPGTALKVNVDNNPIPSAPPPPPLPVINGAKHDNLTPNYGAGYHTSMSPYYLQVPCTAGGQITPSIDGSIGPSPVHIPALPPAPYGTTINAIQPEIPMIHTHYPPSTQVPAVSSPLMIQPPPPPPPPPPLPPSTQYNTQNQNSNTNMNNLNVNVANPDIVEEVKEHHYPNYLSFSIVMCLLCWMFNPFAYICIIPALICSCCSTSANTYGKSKFTGKWAFCCNLTALICGLISFVLFILPIVIIISLATAGGINSIEHFLDQPNDI